LLEAHFDIGIELVGCTQIPEDALLDENWFQGCKAKDDAAGKPAGKNGCNDLC